jgi:hypothetical protein
MATAAMSLSLVMAASTAASDTGLPMATGVIVAGKITLLLIGRIGSSSGMSSIRVTGGSGVARNCSMPVFCSRSSAIAGALSYGYLIVMSTAFFLSRGGLLVMLIVRNPSSKCAAMSSSRTPWRRWNTRSK